MPNNKHGNIVITGPESTGKSQLTYELAELFNGKAVPEYARIYIKNLDKPYNYSDIENIALHQVKEFQELNMGEWGFNFFDTYLEVTKIWFQWCYQKSPRWIDEYLEQAKVDLYLVCDTDIPWIADDLRENSGEAREALLQRYIQEIEKINVPYRIVTGKGKERLDCAVNHIQTYFK